MDNPNDTDGWRKEAESIINDIRHHVKRISLSTVLQSSNSSIYLNMETLEERRFCISITGAGFIIVGEGFDKETDEEGNVYETPQALLTAVSPLFIQSFGNELVTRLTQLSQPDS